MQSLCTDMEVKNPGPGKLSTALTSIDGASLALRVNPDYLQMNLLPPSNNNLMKVQTHNVQPNMLLTQPIGNKVPTMQVSPQTAPEPLAAPLSGSTGSPEEESSPRIAITVPSGPAGGSDSYNEF